MTNPLYLLLTWAEDRRGSKFVNQGKQLAAIKRMKIAGLTPSRIKDRWEEFEGKTFYKDKGFDFNNIAADFDRKP